MKAALTKQFGSFEKFKTTFSGKANTNFASGWTWLVQKDDCTLAVENTDDAKTPFVEDGVTPVLNLDVWEHAYYLLYQNRRADYVKAFFDVVDWDVIGSRFMAAKS